MEEGTPRTLMGFCLSISDQQHTVLKKASKVSSGTPGQGTRQDSSSPIDGLGAGSRIHYSLLTYPFQLHSPISEALGLARCLLRVIKTKSQKVLEGAVEENKWNPS